MSEIKALEWWNSLSESEKWNHEMRVFGYGEPTEDNALMTDDIIKMFIQ